MSMNPARKAAQILDDAILRANPLDMGEYNNAPNIEQLLHAVHPHHIATSYVHQLKPHLNQLTQEQKRKLFTWALQQCNSRYHETVVVELVGSTTWAL